MEFKDIVKEWQEQFPILTTYTPTTLMARADIFLIGLRLERDFETYRAFLEILPLWVPKDKIIIPVFYDETRDKKGFQVFIDNNLHDPLLPDYVEAQKKRGAEIDVDKFELQRKTRRRIIEQAMQCTHNKFDVVFQENVGLSTIFNLIKTKTDGFIKNQHNPNDWYSIFELELALAYHFNDEDLIHKVKSDIEKEYRHWEKQKYDKKIFDDNYKEFIKEHIKNWKSDLYRRMEDREGFKNQVETNLALKKISRLKQIHVYYDLEPSKTLFNKVIDFFRKNK